MALGAVSGVAAVLARVQQSAIAGLLCLTVGGLLALLLAALTRSAGGTDRERTVSFLLFYTVLPLIWAVATVLWGVVLLGG